MSESDVHRPQILASKDGCRAERVNPDVRIGPYDHPAKPTPDPKPALLYGKMHLIERPL